MTSQTVRFQSRRTIEQVEEGTEFTPKFDTRGLITVVTSDASSGELLMQGYMTAEALSLTIQTGEAHYFSRSRNKLWHKGETSGFTQKVVELMVDDDQDCIWLKVDVAGGASCHVGYRSCFYRRLPVAGKFSGRQSPALLKMEFTDNDRVFDPATVYGNEPNPTIL